MSCCSVLRMPTLFDGRSLLMICWCGVVWGRLQVAERGDCFPLGESRAAMRLPGMICGMRSCLVVQIFLSDSSEGLPTCPDFT